MGGTTRRSYPLFHLLVTTSIMRNAGDVIAVDTSASAANNWYGDVYNAGGGANDLQILGICATADFDFDGAPEAAAQQAIVADGSANVRIADNNTDMAPGALLRAEADSQIGRDANGNVLTAQAVGVVDVAGATTVTTGTNVTGEEIQAAYAALHATIGTAMNNVEVSTGDQDDRRVEVLLRFNDLFVITI